ncbi:putative 26S proteasome regulatory subunit [Clavispora lusitaniae]|uniref:26S proteasome regulatory subunit n=1 Tax=Clavispora lusitaniae TaxID=36911 RepID=A0ACD0WNA1_CLALS|nr:putative 26S proteasome regulatory subunit [Clavispora lusitaniae]QFZ34610.1 putative 26S proteasome regulatory subunit [Clavispora lusitaniae]QFZ40295.1 putative 26S proteasome regulatory subunit [Clavispora lusitaniae]QFZ45975.1 putative 26S proteasome regulatory subunit [Clavispora lusitaniae]QFZ51637.1 putative 26S proteasome regulatory subunit [Clavispora lusitaniae]
MAPVKDQVASSEAESQKKKQPVVAEEELSEEDQKLKDDLEALVETLNQPDQPEEDYLTALSTMKNFIKDSTTSMTAVPKPLKFLRPHYSLMTELYEKWSTKGVAVKLLLQLADIISVLATTRSDDGKRESLKYRLLASDDTISDWGHEYMRHLALEIGESYQANLGSDEAHVARLVDLSLHIVPFFLKHNAEADAVDLLLEIENIEKLPQYLDNSTYARVCLYMVSCVPLLAPPDDTAFLHTAYSIYLTHNQLTQALTLAIKLDNEDLIKQVFDSTEDLLVHKQLGFILSQQYNRFKYPGDNEETQEIISNVKLPEFYAYLVEELNLLEPKVPEDIYKSHLEDSRYVYGSGSIDSAKQNLAASFVNAFLNFGYGTDKLILQSGESETKSWIYRTKASGMISATASIGSIYQWNIDEGLPALDRYTYSNDDVIKAGSILGTGIISANINDEAEVSLGLLQEYVSDPKKIFQTSAINGLGIAYAGSANEEVLNLLLPLISDTDISLEASCLASLALGHVFVGTCHGDITSAILQTLLERDFTQLNNKFIRFMALGLGLLYMGKTEMVEDVLDIIDAIEHPINKTLKVLANICAYAGTGNVLQIQSLLQMCSAKPKSDVEEEKKLAESEEDQKKRDGGDTEAASAQGEASATGDEDMEDATTTTTEVKEEEKEKSDSEDEDEEEEIYQGFAVLGLACIAMGEDIGQDMVLRHFSHLMHYGNPLIRRTVPLAMGLVSASYPQMKVFDTLSRYSHDPDLEVSQNAIYAMGLVGAGTNNARLAQLLRQLAQYYSKSPDSLFMVRIAQGILYLGKGTLSLTPFNSERSILNKVSLAALLTVSVSLLDPKSFILSDSTTETSHQMLYYLTPAIKPRMLITVDEDLNPIKVNVRVGQAVDVVGQAGKPKTITGWVTQATPVLLSYGERAELENNEEWISLSHTLEGIVILKKAPESTEGEN